MIGAQVRDRGSWLLESSSLCARVERRSVCGNDGVSAVTAVREQRHSFVLPDVVPSVRMGRSLKDAHALHSDHVIRELRVDAAAGLTEGEVLARRAELGANVLSHARNRPLLRVLLDQFLNIIVLLLAAAAAISWLTGDRIESLAILLVLLLNAAIGFAMEWQAGRALDVLRKQTRITRAFDEAAGTSTSLPRSSSSAMSFCSVPAIAFRPTCASSKRRR